jgi:arylsulfatase A-like enzyme
VILIVLDTVRADHLGCYGYPRATSPRLDAFARQATLFRRAFAAAPATLASHASLFTGRHPLEHGAHAFEVQTPASDNMSPLAAEHLTLAESLAELGYATQGFVANKAYLAERWNLQQGFQGWRVRRVTAARLNDEVEAWLAGMRRRSFHLFLNYMDAPDSEEHGLLEQLGELVLRGRGEIPGELAGQVVDQYDTAIANLDQELGRLFDMLAAADAYDGATIVVTADHGESFGEHHLVGHGKDLYQEAVHVPLIVKRPGQRKGEVREEPVSGVDVARLIVDTLPAGLSSRLAPRFPYRPGSHPVLIESHHASVNVLFHPVWGRRFRRVRLAVFEWPWKYIHSSDGKHELYDLQRDPGERHDLAAERPELSQRLAGTLMAFRARREATRSPPSAPPLSEEDREALRALGYLGDTKP